VPWAAAEPTRYVHSDSITIWLFAPTQVRAGELVPMRVELENTSDRGWINVRLGGRAPRERPLPERADRELELPRSTSHAHTIAGPFGAITLGLVDRMPAVHVATVHIISRT
jgi:hypothetical protein